MTSRRLRRSLIAGLIALPLLSAAPVVPAADGCAPEAGGCGIVPLGLGLPAVEGLDHRRHLIPAAAVGIVVHATLQGGLTAPTPARLGLEGCPPTHACTPGPGPPRGCLLVYADVATVSTPYAFSWTRDADAATHLFADLPRHDVPVRSTPPPGPGCV